MSGKSAGNNGKVNGEVVKQLHTEPKPNTPKGKSVATRLAEAEVIIDQLRSDVEFLKAELGRASRLLAGQLENQAVQAALPAVEQQIRGQIAQQYQQGGLAALLGEVQQPAPEPEPATPAP